MAHSGRTKYHVQCAIVGSGDLARDGDWDGHGRRVVAEILSSRRAIQKGCVATGTAIQAAWVCNAVARVVRRTSPPILLLLIPPSLHFIPPRIPIRLLQRPHQPLEHLHTPGWHQLPCQLHRRSYTCTFAQLAGQQARSFFSFASIIPWQLLYVRPRPVPATCTSLDGPSCTPPNAFQSLCCIYPKCRLHQISATGASRSSLRRKR